MPFGFNCEFQDFDACVKKHMQDGKTKEAAEKICGALMRDTEARCRKSAAKKVIEKSLEADEQLIRLRDHRHGYEGLVKFPTLRDMAKDTVVKRIYNFDGKFIRAEPYP